MAWTSVGFDGTITEIQWAGMAGLLGNGYVAAGNGDCLVTAVSGARSVSVAAGSLYGDGVLSTNSAPETVAMTTPVNGQWYVIALRRTWATNTAALVAIAGATTSTTTPTAPPTSFPVLNADSGVLTDQPIAWAWCNSANTTVVVYDIRLKAVKSLPPVVATSAERDAKFMSPTQGLQVWRDDLGAVETYYGLYNASTNPGGRDTAGWYTNSRAGGLVPISPTSVSVASGTATATSLGAVSFASATSLTLNNVFTSEYTNYRIVLTIHTSTDGWIQARFATGGTTNTANSYAYGNFWSNSAATQIQASSPNTQILLHRVGTLSAAPVQMCVVDIVNPQQAAATTLLATMNGWYATLGTVAGWFNASTQFDGFTILPTAGSMGGRIQVFGYND